MVIQAPNAIFSSSLITPLKRLGNLNLKLFDKLIYVNTVKKYWYLVKHTQSSKLVLFCPYLNLKTLAQMS